MIAASRDDVIFPFIDPAMPREKQIRPKKISHVLMAWLISLLRGVFPSSFLEYLSRQNSTFLPRQNPANVKSAILIVVCLACIAFPASLSARTSVNVPLDSWVYNSLDLLEAFGLIKSALSGMRPYSRLEAARLTAEGIKRWDKLPDREKSVGFTARTLIPSHLERLKKEFEAELAEFSILEGPRADTYLKPIDEVAFKYLYQTDDPVLRPQRGNPPTHAISPVTNNFGRTYRKHHNFSVALQGEGRLWNRLAFFYRPLLMVSEGEGGEIQLEKGYIKAGVAGLELQIGRDSLWWGPGYHGALLMTNNARPFNMIRLSNPHPFDLPFLGLFKFNLFLSQLDYGPPNANKPLLYGLRLNFKPHPIFELGVSHVVVFKGRDGGDVACWDYLRILSGTVNREGTPLDSNQQAALDFRLRWLNFDRILPLARSLKFYGELGSEGMNYPLDRLAFMLGFTLYDLFLLGSLNLRVEYGNTSLGRNPTVWYVHGRYPPIYRNRIFGHHAGSNAEDFFVRLTASLSEKTLLGADFNAETHGKRDALKTISYQTGLDLHHQISNRMSLKGRYTWENFRDRNYIAGGSSIRHLFGIEMRLNF